VNSEHLNPIILNKNTDLVTASGSKEVVLVVADVADVVVAVEVAVVFVIVDAVIVVVVIVVLVVKMHVPHRIGHFFRIAKPVMGLSQDSKSLASILATLLGQGCGSCNPLHRAVVVVEEVVVDVKVSDVTVAVMLERVTVVDDSVVAVTVAVTLLNVSVFVLVVSVAVVAVDVIDTDVLLSVMLV
jgi:hypothetical protein